MSKLGREGQKRMVKQLTRENELLRRRITGFQLALKVGKGYLCFLELFAAFRDACY